MTNTAAPAAKSATVRVVRDGMNLSRFSVATGALLATMLYSEWDSSYTVSRADGRKIRTMDRDRAHYALALCK